MFFAKELAGEPPLGLVTAERLVTVSRRLAEKEFWKYLLEDEIVAVAGESQMLYLQVMGQFGEFQSVTAYRGQRGLRYLDDMMSERLAWPGEALERHDLIRVRFAARKDLRTADRALLEALGVPKVRGVKVPEFSSCRPGFYDWHVNDAEGKDLAHALELLERILVMVEASGEITRWPKSGFCPLVTEDADGSLKVEQVSLNPDEEPEEHWEAPAAWPAKPLGKGGLWEMGQFCAAAAVGAKAERKSIFCATAVMETERGIALAMEAASADGPRLPALWEGFVKAVGNVGNLPESLAVNSNAHAAMLRPVAERLGFDLVVKPRLEALEESRYGLLLSMGETPFRTAE